jgi:hypothetical protein
MMSIELLNHDKFVAKLQQYKDASRRNMARVINHKLGDVAVTAIGTTYRTNTAKIASEIQRVEGRVVTKKVFKPFGLTKSGKVKKRKIGEYAVGYKAKSVSYAGTYKLVNWLLKNRGPAHARKDKTWFRWSWYVWWQPPQGRNDWGVGKKASCWKEAISKLYTQRLGGGGGCLWQKNKTN